MTISLKFSISLSNVKFLIFILEKLREKVNSKRKIHRHSHFTHPASSKPLKARGGGPLSRGEFQKELSNEPANSPLERGGPSMRRQGGAGCVKIIISKIHPISC